MLVFAAWFGRFAYLRITLEPTPRPEYWAKKILALDPPGEDALSPQELDALMALDPQLAMSRGGVTSVSRDDFAYRAWPGEEPDPYDTRPPLTDAELRPLGSPAFAAIRRQWEAAAVRGWHRRWLPTTLDVSSFSFTRSSVQWLVIHARYVRATAGEGPEIVSDWETALHLVREEERSRCAVNCLVVATCLEVITEDMVSVIGEQGPRLDTAELMQRVDDALGPAPPVPQMLAGERLFILDRLDRAYVREGGDWLNVSFLLSDWKPGCTRAWNLLSPVFHDRATAGQNVDLQFQHYKAVDTLVALERVSREPGSQILNALDGCWDLDLPRGPMRVYEVRCRLDAATTLLALREYFEDRGGYPASLDELVPRYLPRLPLDYADRQPLRYRRTNTGYVLYSIGYDGVDDGGVATIDPPHRFRDNRSGTRNRDVVFSTWHHSAGEE